MSYQMACQFVRETDAAILIIDPASGEEIWLPLSQVDEIHRDPNGNSGTIVMSDWIAKQKGLD